MTKRFNWWCVIAFVGIPLLLGRSALGQDNQDRDRWGGGEDVWTNDDNWFDVDGELSGAPSPTDVDRWALVQSGNVLVEEEISTSGLDVSGGSVQINNGASLTVDIVDGAFSVGQTRITGNGAVRILGDGKYTTELDASNSGMIDLQSPTASFETKGDFKTTGTLAISVTDAGISTVKVGGEASVRGVVAPTFTGVNPVFGDSFDFLTGASSVSVGKTTVELPPGVTVGRGLDVRVEATSNSTAGIVFGNLPILELDRLSGATKIVNAVGDPVTMTGYSISSKNGLLGPAGLTGLNAAGVEGWEAPNPMADAISEINLTGEVGLAVGDANAISLGNIYAGAAADPGDEDVTFQFSTIDGDIVNGFVEYTGPAKDFTAYVNPDSGEITLSNLNPNFDAVDLTGYQVLSASESLDPSAWTSINDSGEAGWTEANPKAGAINELSLESSLVFKDSEFSLGEIFKTDGIADIQVQYTTTNSDKVLDARIEYGEVPDVGEGLTCADVRASRAIDGDLNGDNAVNFTDFLVLSTNFNTAQTMYEEGDIDCNGTVAFPDFLVLSTNFGMEAGATAASVPEPSGIVLLSCCVGLLVLRRRRSIAA